jgi:hypothetical protein
MPIRIHHAAVDRQAHDFISQQTNAACVQQISEFVPKNFIGKMNKKTYAHESMSNFPLQD